MATEFYDAGDVPENAIEWLKGRKTATVTLAGGSALNHKVRRLAKDMPDKCQITDENEDKTIVAHIPVSWIKITPSPELTEEQRAERSARAKEILSRNTLSNGVERPKTASKPKSRKTVRSKK